MNVRSADVRFTYYLNGSPITGQLPLTRAEIELDLKTLQNARIETHHDTRKATGGFIFATHILRGPGMFDAQNHPIATFQSLRFDRTPDGAIVQGRVTIKGITQPVTLSALAHYTAAQTMQVDMTGRIDRRAFAMAQYPKLVGPFIDLHIQAVFDISGR